METIRDTVHFFGRHKKAGIDHAQRAEQALLKNLIERLALNPLDDRAKHIGGYRIVPVSAGVELQRDFGKFGNKFVQTALAVKIV